MIDKDGNVFGYVTGTLTADIMESIVQQLSLIHIYISSIIPLQLLKKKTSLLVLP